jgi:hypothetical protein
LLRNFVNIILRLLQKKAALKKWETSILSKNAQTVTAVAKLRSGLILGNGQAYIGSDQPGTPYLSYRLSIVDLHIKIACFVERKVYYSVFKAASCFK